MSTTRSPAAALAAFALALIATTASASASMAVGTTVERPSAFAVTAPLRDTSWQLPAAVRHIIADRDLGTMQLAELEQRLVEAGVFDNPPTREVKARGRPRLALARPRTVRDPVRQKGTGLPVGTKAPTAATTADFAGIPHTGYAPPDANIAVGENDIVEMVNDQFAVFDKHGTLLMGPVDSNVLWQSLGGDCARRNDGDPVVLYDRSAHRWLLSQFTSPDDDNPQGSTGPYYECIAVSRTDDPTGGYYAYAYKTSDTVFADYPKLGIWPDAYYATFNDFHNNELDGVTVAAYDRSAILKGRKDAPMQKVRVPISEPGAVSLLPADPDGPVPPPAGEPELFLSYASPNGFPGNGYALELWRMHVDWTTPSNSVFKGPEAIPVPPFNDFLCHAGGYPNNCIPQPHGAPGIDSISFQLMYRLAYRNFGDHEAVVVNQTVGVGSDGNRPPAGIRWYQLTTSSSGAGDWSLAQTGTWAPTDGNSRWMGSAAMDDDGDIMLGYSVSGPHRYPSIAVTGRLAKDPKGVMTLPEQVLIPGEGVKLGGADAAVEGVRWGDYSSMVVDPADDRTFWYVNEYYPQISEYDWSTGIAAIRFDTGQGVTSGAITGTVTDARSGDPIAHAVVEIEPGDIRTLTGRNGRYRIAVDAGDYTVTPAKYPFSDHDSKHASVAAGQTVTEDFSLPHAPLVPLSGTITDAGMNAGVHGWGLFARVVLGVSQLGELSRVGETYSAPATGHYSIEVPVGYRYVVGAVPALRAYRDGYDPARASATVEEPASLDFKLPVKPGCTAPGYGATHNVHENFDSGTFPPAGWQVVNELSGSEPVWGTEQDFGKHVANWTGGALHAAMIDASFCGTQCTPVDTSLLTPPIPVSRLGGATELTYRANGSDVGRLDVGISTDGGQSWTTLLRWQNTWHGGARSLPGVIEGVDLAKHLPASGDFQLRWRYEASAFETHFADAYAQIDDVAIGTCHFRPGGLVTGQLTDSAGNGVTGATLTDDRGDSTTTYATGKNAALGDIYALFTRAGHRTLTATDGTRGAAVAAVDVADDHASRRDLAFGTADVAVRQQAPASLPRDGLGTATTVTVTNHGPDPAPGVRLAVASSAYLRLESARPAQGRCRLAGGTGIECDLGNIPAGASVAVTVKAFGAYAGQAAITARAAADNNDPAPDNNAATAQVTVKATASPGSGGGGGALGWLALAGLLALALTGWRRGAQRQGSP